MKKNEQILLPTLAIPDSANYSLPDDSLLSFYTDLEERIFWVSDEINNYSLNLAHYILKWNREDRGIPVEKRKPIKLLIHSLGGELDIFRVLSDLIELSETPVYGINLGNAYSAAGLILLSCHKRFGLKSSNVLFHKGSCDGISGSFSEVAAFMDEYEKQVAELSEVILKKTKFTKEEVEKNMNGDWYVSAEDCVKHGVYDKIITSIFEIIGNGELVTE